VPFVLGEPTIAPLGLIAYCQRQSEECAITLDASPDEEQNRATGGNTKSDRPNSYPAVSQRDSHSQDQISLAGVAHTTRVEIAFERFNEIERVNRQINSRLTWVSDYDQFGVEEFWTLPLQAGLANGDCEDFALEKRRALLELGFDPAALAMATSTSAATGNHAVLIVRTTQGDYVLDNTTPWVLPWTETAYQWQAIQSGETMTAWRNLSVSIR